MMPPAARGSGDQTIRRLGAGLERDGLGSGAGRWRLWYEVGSSVRAEAYGVGPSATKQVGATTAPRHKVLAIRGSPPIGSRSLSRRNGGNERRQKQNGDRIVMRLRSRTHSQKRHLPVQENAL